METLHNGQFSVWCKILVTFSAHTYYCKTKLFIGTK